MSRCPVCDAKVPASILEIHVNQCIEVPGTGILEVLKDKKVSRGVVDRPQGDWETVAHSKGAQVKAQEAKRVDSRPEHLRAKTRQHTGALQQILVHAEEDKRTVKEAQAREREEVAKKPNLYTFGLPDDVLLLVLPHLDARSLARAARVCIHWKGLANHSSVWRERYVKDFVGADKNKQAQLRQTRPNNWRDAYILAVQQQPLLQVALQAPANRFEVLSRPAP